MDGPSKFPPVAESENGGREGSQIFRERRERKGILSKFKESPYGDEGSSCDHRRECGGDSETGKNIGSNLIHGDTFREKNKRKYGVASKEGSNQQGLAHPSAKGDRKSKGIDVPNGETVGALRINPWNMEGWRKW